MGRPRKRALEKQNTNGDEDTAAATSKGKGFPESSLASATENQYKEWYMKLEEKAEELMLHKLTLNRELFHARGQNKVYEKMLADLGVALSASAQSSIDPATEAAAAPEAATNLQDIMKNKKKNQVAPDEEKKDSPRKKRKQKNNA